MSGELLDSYIKHKKHLVPRWGLSNSFCSIIKVLGFTLYSILLSSSSYQICAHKKTCFLTGRPSFTPLPYTPCTLGLLTPQRHWQLSSFDPLPTSSCRLQHRPSFRVLASPSHKHSWHVGCYSVLFKVVNLAGLVIRRETHNSRERVVYYAGYSPCLLYTSPSPRDRW